MTDRSRPKRLERALGLLDVYALATGATLSSGFFLLPGIAAAEAGPAMILCYALAVIPLIPATLSKIELATAMPRAGGAYFFLDRSMGPLMGTIGGIGTWLALILKSAFALIGMGAYIGLFFPKVPVVPLAIFFAVVFGLLNLRGSKESGAAQVLLLFGLFAILGWFFSLGIFRIEPAHYAGFFDRGFDAILRTTGLVYVSYVGVTKVISVSEEIKNPERNLPLGVILSVVTAVFVYILGTSVLVGILAPAKLYGSLTPWAAAAEAVSGRVGKILLSIAALFAFSSVANAGVLSSSRYPLAMSRDHLLPPRWRRCNARGVPANSILLSVGTIIVLLLFFDATKIAKLASSFQLILFALQCVAVIVMRESGLASYDPGFRSPLYPWMQIVGMLAPFFLIVQMGWIPMLFSLGLFGVGTAWYFSYARSRVIRDGAIYHIFERLGRQRYEGLDLELRTILKEKGLRKEDPFDRVIAEATVIDVEGEASFEQIVEQASQALALRLSVPAETIYKGFMEGSRVGATPVEAGCALPHLRLPGIEQPEIVLVRAVDGIEVEILNEFWGDHSPNQSIYAFFFLVSPEENPGQHLRFLAQIAERADDEGFIDEWRSAPDEQELKEILLRNERYLSLVLRHGTRTEGWIDRKVRDIPLPDGCLVAIIHRNRQILVPRGDTRLQEGDRLTVIGEVPGIRKLRTDLTDLESEE